MLDWINWKQDILHIFQRVDSLSTLFVNIPSFELIKFLTILGLYQTHVPSYGFFIGKNYQQHSLNILECLIIHSCSCRRSPDLHSCKWWAKCSRIRLLTPNDKSLILFKAYFPFLLFLRLLSYRLPGSWQSLSSDTCTPLMVALINCI